MISLAEISSNKNIERPVIVAFLRTSIKFNIRHMLLALSRRLTRWLNEVLLYLLLLSDLFICKKRDLISKTLPDCKKQKNMKHFASSSF